MDPMTMAMLASAGSSLLGGLFGGRKQKVGYQMSPEEQTLLGQLRAELKNIPGHVTAPFVRERKSIERRHARQAGASGIVSALKGRLGVQQTEAVGIHRRGLLSQIAGLVSGRGTQTAETGAGGWGDILGGIGGDIGFLWGLQQMMGGGSQTGGGNKPGGGMRFQPGFLGSKPRR